MENTIKDVIKASVEQGIAFLDEKYGRLHWPLVIKWEVLDMGDGALCVGGQLEGDYLAFVERWSISYEDARDCAFTRAHEPLPDDMDKEDVWQMLTKVWAERGEHCAKLILDAGA